MSRIGKKPIVLPESVKVEISGRDIKISGTKGELTYKLNKGINVKEEDKNILIEITNEDRKSAQLFGLTRTLIFNMVHGVSEGFEKKLEFHGVGYRANIEASTLVMQLGFSHPIKYTMREGIEIKVEKNVITVSGVDKQLVGQTAAEIREFKKPEPYKGKGIRYVGEKVRRKAGKVAAKAA